MFEPLDTACRDRFEQSLAAARAGARDALGPLLEVYRDYLLELAEQELDSAMRAKAGASDLVQETFLKAHQEIDRFRGQSAQELLAWLRVILVNNLANFNRRFRATNKRQITRESSLSARDPDAGPWDGPAAAAPSACQDALRREQARLINRALEKLPDHYLQVVLLHHCDQQSFEAIGKLTHRSAEAARKLWVRAIHLMKTEVEALDAR